MCPTVESQIKPATCVHAYLDHALTLSRALSQQVVYKVYTGKTGDSMDSCTSPYNNENTENLARKIEFRLGEQDELMDSEFNMHKIQY